MIERDRFWSVARPIFHGPTQSQVNGTNAILDGFEARYTANFDPRWLAYTLATAYWETAHTMQPIEEYGHGAGHPYGEPDPQTGQTYYGRGYVQLTWKSNYDRMGHALNVELVNHPELALDPAIAASVMFLGMDHGMFTGVGLGRYFSATADDPVNARRIINGTDHANEIAHIHTQFLGGL